MRTGIICCAAVHVLLPCISRAISGFSGVNRPPAGRMRAVRGHWEELSSQRPRSLVALNVPYCVEILHRGMGKIMSNIAAFTLGVMVAYAPSLIVLGLVLWNAYRSQTCCDANPASQAIVLRISQRRNAIHSAVAATATAMTIIDASFDRRLERGGGLVGPVSPRSGSGKLPSSSV